MKKLILVIDMQNDFVYGSLGSEEAQAAVGEVLSLLKAAAAEGAEIVFTKDTHGADYLSTQEGKFLPVPHCIKGTAGHDLVKELAPYEQNAVVFEKGAFGSPALAEFVRDGNYGEVVLCGVCTDICVVSNALLIKAYCPELPVRVKAKACAGTSVAAHEAALLTMKSCQITVE